ncbi:5-formyltetrahydrofolate cyclo-ligase [Natranaerovirga pectinivora]|uniref:5-formyltetrahydrofolate cyclo-ligase n=1 Tax=Natranaerovirga pectinivora TaxID=682400 RepID=A0A4R3MQB7_9FIRM|nr:5-formyltetrahydrofolate cyclo-ligase [Natranaerovirga pectinivora]TCT17072.1 5-formyltetrahydrofolate cyclo-ligase [Natranaerovirga pectinivora]
MTKKEIRRFISQKKSLLREDKIRFDSETIARTLLEQVEYDSCNTIFVYVPFNQEVRTQGIIEQGWMDHKRIAVPKIVDNVMRFYYISSWNDLQIGYYNILEPHSKEEALLDETTLVIMPGLAFDTQRNRIGYGGGFYDKFLEDRKPFSKIALTFDFQVLDSIPNEHNDIKPDTIITEKRIIRGDKDV